MSFEILWHYPALRTFHNLPMHSAVMVDRAVIRFAERGEGRVESEPPYLRLRTGFHDVILSVDREARTLTVLRIYRAAS